VGQAFRYVADASLDAHRHRDLPCPLCRSRDEVHSFFAEPEGGYITEACARCIRSLPLAVIAPWRSERLAVGHLREVFPGLPADELEQRGAAMCAELRRTPRVPAFCQEDEWPLCCGDFAEYVGHPGLPEGSDGIGGLSLFRCPGCGRGFEVFQCP